MCYDNYDITIVKVVPRMQFQVFMDINLYCIWQCFLEECIWLLIYLV